jgi:succinylglutamate desuccinylase
MGFPNTNLLLNRLNPWTLVLLLALVAPVASAESIRVLSQNMDRLFDNIDDGNNEQVVSQNRFRKRVKYAAKKFGDHFGLPHIIALQEVENLNVLQQIAT